MRNSSSRSNKSRESIRLRRLCFEVFKAFKKSSMQYTIIARNMRTRIGAASSLWAITFHLHKRKQRRLVGQTIQWLTLMMIPMMSISPSRCSMALVKWKSTTPQRACCRTIRLTTRQWTTKRLTRRTAARTTTRWIRLGPTRVKTCSFRCKRRAESAITPIFTALKASTPRRNRHPYHLC